MMIFDASEFMLPLPYSTMLVSIFICISNLHVFLYYVFFTSKKLLQIITNLILPLDLFYICIYSVLSCSEYIKSFSCYSSVVVSAHIIQMTVFWQFSYCSYFIKLLIEKKYALPYRVLDAMVAHFMKFCDDSRVMPVIWHQSLLAFVQRLVFLVYSFIFSYLGLCNFVFLHVWSFSFCFFFFFFGFLVVSDDNEKPGFASMAPFEKKLGFYWSCSQCTNLGLFKSSNPLQYTSL